MAHIVVLATGGTIAGQSASASDAVGYRAGRIGADALMAAVPGMPAILQDDTLVTEQVAQIDSKDMDMATWQVLAQRCVHWLSGQDTRGVVVTHGTDTLEETAYFLMRALEAARAAGVLSAACACKPVVLTCAMRPATARMPDGPQNLADALAVLRHAAAQGVLAVCAGKVHDALHVSKVHPYRLDAFRSGDGGPMGYVEEGRVRWVRSMQAKEACMRSDRQALEPAGAASMGPQAEAVTASRALWQAICTRPARQWPWVEIVSSHAGAGAAALDAMVRAGLAGAVLAGTGNATVHHALEQAAVRALQAGVAVWRSTRCGAGQVVPGHASPVALALDGATVLSPPKARVALLLELLPSSGLPRDGKAQPSASITPANNRQ